MELLNNSNMWAGARKNNITTCAPIAVQLLESTMFTRKSFGAWLSIVSAKRKLCSEWMDDQTGLSLHWVLRSFFFFSCSGSFINRHGFKASMLIYKLYDFRLCPKLLPWEIRLIDTSFVLCLSCLFLSLCLSVSVSLSVCLSVSDWLA